MKRSKENQAALAAIPAVAGRWFFYFARRAPATP